MSAALHLCTPADMDYLLPLVARFHAEEGIKRSEDQQRAALKPLLQGIPHGVAYLIGPQRSPVGYIVISFGYSVEFGGIDAFIDELFIRPGIRGRGIASEVLARLLPALFEHDVQAIHLEVSPDSRARRLYSRAGFQARDGYRLMSKVFKP